MLPTTNEQQQIWWINEFTKRMRKVAEGSKEWCNYNYLRSNAIKEWRTIRTLKAV